MIEKVSNTLLVQTLLSTAKYRGGFRTRLPAAVCDTVVGLLDRFAIVLPSVRAVYYWVVCCVWCVADLGRREGSVVLS